MWESGWLTAVGLLMAVLAVGDIWLYKKHGKNATLSRVLLELDQRYRWVAYVVLFAMGLLAGHFFWPQHVE